MLRIVAWMLLILMSGCSVTKISVRYEEYEIAMNFEDEQPRKFVR